MNYKSKTTYFNNPYSVIKYLLLAYFSYLMVLITLQYLPPKLEVAFLRTKQNVEYSKWYQMVFFSHVFSSMFVLLVGFTQFSNYFQKRFTRLHRNIGKMYIFIVVCISGPAGFCMGVVANGGFSSQLSFCLLATCWIWFTIKAFTSIKKGDILNHKIWMYRSYALTLSALSLRFWKMVIVAAFEPRPMDAYRIVAWLGWVCNLLLAEWIIRRYLQNKQMAVK